MNYALIFAAGIGSRMKSETPKQFLEIKGCPIIAYTLMAFDKCASIDCIIVVTLKEQVENVWRIVNRYNINKVIDIVEGGATAFESQRIGVIKVNSISKENDIVLVHDGVRPFVNSKTIDACIESVVCKGNAITVSPAAETVAITGGDNKIYETARRQKCLIARAPQAFYVNDLYKAHIKALDEKKEYIDSASMFLDQGVPLNPIIGPDENIKITTQYDYKIAKLLLGDKK